MKVLITGCNGLVGSEAVEFYDRRGDDVVGVDNNQRAAYFGPAGDTTANLDRLRATTRHFEHHAIDVRDRARMAGLFAERRFDFILHCAAQPSHDKAAEIPLIDFEVNALATVQLLEAARQHCPEAVFVLLSTNKVYGDAPNELPLVELPTRYDYADEEDRHGIREDCRIDHSLHSVFGASKVAADLMTQEYGRYFGLATGVFRAGCLTGARHAAVELHGFLSHLVKTAVAGRAYTVHGYKGKQVRDNLHAHDVVRAAEAFRQAPRPGAVYNLGGGRGNSISLLEAIDQVDQRIGRKRSWSYQEQPRRGDHVCYISDLRKFQRDYPGWQVTRSLDAILDELVAFERSGAALP
jgi:CDP-paratose 2-epimerase